MCRVPNCNACASSAKHFCKNCGNNDVTHRSANCPTLKGKSPCRLSCPHCKGTVHLCKGCGNNDVNHRSANCNYSRTGRACRAHGCTSCKGRQLHICSCCGEYDATHTAIHCPQKKAVIVHKREFRLSLHQM